MFGGFSFCCIGERRLQENTLIAFDGEKKENGKLFTL
jgi:hypothetical protein